eukprot:TRINITY_DN60435_c0_g1_i1.p1 TRINITY_DN60435_c0_g1~~TRINITY_DN60435_c0_g1_i1.p1  ORF type:complete len:733 (-),score=67.06 TRINITY_DN60435_c0_g1_i1:242-2440(-)
MRKNYVSPTPFSDWGSDTDFPESEDLEDEEEERQWEEAVAATRMLQKWWRKTLRKYGVYKRWMSDCQHREATLRSDLQRTQWVRWQEIETEAIADYEWSLMLEEMRKSDERIMGIVSEAEQENRVRLLQAEKEEYTKIQQRESKSYFKAKLRATVAAEEHARTSVFVRERMEGDRIWQQMKQDYLMLLLTVQDNTLGKAVRKTEENEKLGRDTLLREEHAQWSLIVHPLGNLIHSLQTERLEREETMARMELFGDHMWEQRVLMDTVVDCEYESLQFQEALEWDILNRNFATTILSSFNKQLCAKEKYYRDRLVEYEDDSWQDIVDTYKSELGELHHLVIAMIDTRLETIQDDQQHQYDELVSMEIIQRAQISSQYTVEKAVKERWVLIQQEAVNRNEYVYTEGRDWRSMVDIFRVEQLGVVELQELIRRQKILQQEQLTVNETFLELSMQTKKMLRELGTKAVVNIQRVWRGHAARKRTSKLRDRKTHDTWKKHQAAVHWRSVVTGFTQEENMSRRGMILMEKHARRSLRFAWNHSVDTIFNKFLDSLRFSETEFRDKLKRSWQDGVQELAIQRERIQRTIQPTQLAHAQRHSIFRSEADQRVAIITEEREERLTMWEVSTELVQDIHVRQDFTWEETGDYFLTNLKEVQLLEEQERAAVYHSERSTVKRLWNRYRQAHAQCIAVAVLNVQEEEVVARDKVQEMFELGLLDLKKLQPTWSSFVAEAWNSSK